MNCFNERSYQQITIETTSQMRERLPDRILTSFTLFSPSRSTLLLLGTKWPDAISYSEFLPALIVSTYCTAYLDFVSAFSGDIGDVTRHAHPLISVHCQEQTGVSANRHRLLNICHRQPQQACIIQLWIPSNARLRGCSRFLAINSFSLMHARQFLSELNRFSGHLC